MLACAFPKLLSVGIPTEVVTDNADYCLSQSQTMQYPMHISYRQ